MGRPKKEIAKENIATDTKVENIVINIPTDIHIDSSTADTVEIDTEKVQPLVEESIIDQIYESVIQAHKYDNEYECMCKHSIPMEKNEKSVRLDSDYPMHPPVEKLYNITTSSAPF